MAGRIFFSFGGFWCIFDQKEAKNECFFNFLGFSWIFKWVLKVFGHFLLDILHIVPFSQKFKPKSFSMLQNWVLKFWKLIFQKWVIRFKNSYCIQLIDENEKISTLTNISKQNFMIYMSPSTIFWLEDFYQFWLLTRGVISNFWKGLLL